MWRRRKLKRLPKEKHSKIKRLGVRQRHQSHKQEREEEMEMEEEEEEEEEEVETTLLFIQ